MKKLFLLVLAFCICLSFSACTATDPNNLFETDSTNELEEIILYQGIYQYGNMQKNLPPGDFMLIGNEVVFNSYRDGHDPVLSYNMLTGEVRYFCKDATCKHEDCVAALSTNLEVYKGKLYGTRSVESGKNWFWSTGMRWTLFSMGKLDLFFITKISCI